MSDLFETRQKVEEGAQWRGEITVAIDGDKQELCVRQLRDPEFWEVMSLVDTDELAELQDNLPEDKMEEFNELRDADDLSEADEKRLEELQKELEDSDVNMFEVVSTETFQGIRKAAKYGIEPDDKDKREALVEYGDKIKEQYGRATNEEAAEYINDHVIDPMIESSTDFTSFTIGIKVLTETIGDTGKLEN